MEKRSCCHCDSLFRLNKDRLVDCRSPDRVHLAGRLGPYEVDSDGSAPKTVAGPKIRTVAQILQAFSRVSQPKDIAVRGRTPFLKGRISCAIMFFPPCSPIVPLISCAAMPRMKVRLVVKNIEPAFLPGFSELMVFIPFDRSFGSGKGFFCRIRGTRRGFRSQEAWVPSNIRRKKFCRLAIYTGRATARSPSVTEILVSRPLRAAGTFFLHARM